jgi:hypothetical protein
MYTPWIIDYMERTPPETALKVNTESGRKMIRREAKAAVAELMSAKDSFALTGLQDSSKFCFDKAVFATKWLCKFGINDAE